MFSKLRNNGRGQAGHDAVLTASEVGEYEFCRVAWYLRRCGVPQDPTSVRNLKHGTQEHRRIAVHASRAKTLHALQRFLLIVIIALLAAAVLQLLRTSGIPEV